MNREQSENLTEWMLRSSMTISHGEVRVEIIMRDGRVQRIVRSIIESELLEGSNKAQRTKEGGRGKEEPASH